MYGLFQWDNPTHECSWFVVQELCTVVNDTGRFCKFWFRWRSHGACWESIHGLVFSYFIHVYYPDGVENANTLIGIFHTTQKRRCVVYSVLAFMYLWIRVGSVRWSIFRMHTATELITHLAQFCIDIYYPIQIFSLSTSYFSLSRFHSNNLIKP